MRGVALAILVAVCLLPAAAATGDGLPPTVAPGELVAGKTVVDWDVEWNRWMISHRSRALGGKAHICAPDGDHGEVWFLSVGGGDDDHVISIDCAVPAGR